MTENKDKNSTISQIFKRLAKVLLVIVINFIFMEVALRIGGYEPWQIYQPLFPQMPETQLRIQPALYPLTSCNTFIF